MKNKDLLTIIGATTISGLLSGYFLLSGFFEDYDTSLTLYTPGIFFGILTAIAFLLIFKLHPIKAALWAAGAFASWYVALNAYIPLSSLGGMGGAFGSTPTEIQASWSFFVPGMIGGIMLSLCFLVLVRKIKLTKVLLNTLVGGVLGVAMYFVVANFGGFEQSSLMIAFTLWQVGIGLALVYDFGSTPAVANSK